MKKKNTSVDSIEIIHNINNGKVEKEKVEIKVGSIFPLPLDKEIITARTSILNNQGNLKAVEHLADILKEDRVGDLSTRAISSLGKVVNCKLRLDRLQLHKRIYEMIPEVNGMTLGFDKSYTGFKILKTEEDDLNTLTEVLRMMEELENFIKPNNPEVAEKMTENVDRLRGLDIPASKKTELAEKIAKAQIVIDKIDKAEADGVEPEVTEEELQMVKDSTESVKSILGVLTKDGGIA